MVLKGIFLATTYVFVLTYQVRVFSLILTSFMQGLIYPPPLPHSTSNKTLKSLARLRLTSKKEKQPSFLWKIS